ncbi:MAG TPA: hypothetical protein VFK16_00800 [Gemmatimonadaceae bacterium]|nr:hypothetical protein [Gemmatimonadaceae bacterium]
MPYGHRRYLAGLLAGLIAVPLSAQQAAQQASPPPVDWSGLVYAQWQNGGTRAQRPANAFDITRAYLTFRMPAGEHVRMQVTTDALHVAAQPGQPGGWSIRLKFAFAEWAAWRGQGGHPGALAVLVGLQPTPEISPMERFWQRGIAKTPIDELGYVSPADLGVAARYTLPGQRGEVVAGVYNGSGYTSQETDRFKDVHLRLSWTPLAARTDAGWLRGLEIMPYYARGYRARLFDPAGSGLQKDRWGLHVGAGDRRLLLAAGYAGRTDAMDTALNPAVTKVTGAVYSASAIVRPFALLHHTADSPWSVVLRGDHYTPNTSASGYQRFLIGGIGYDLNSKVAVYADLQDVEGHQGVTADTKAFLVQFVMHF